MRLMTGSCLDQARNVLGGEDEEHGEAEQGPAHDQVGGARCGDGGGSDDDGSFSPRRPLRTASVGRSHDLCGCFGFDPGGESGAWGENGLVGFRWGGLHVLAGPVFSCPLSTRCLSIHYGECASHPHPAQCSLSLPISMCLWLWHSLPNPLPVADPSESSRRG